VTGLTTPGAAPSIEPLLDWAAEELDRAGGRLPSAELVARVSARLQAFIGQLDVLLALDRRFCRSADGDWELVSQRARESDATVLVEQALALREQAIAVLLAERGRLQEQLAQVRARTSEIGGALARLGHGRH